MYLSLYQPSIKSTIRWHIKWVAIVIIIQWVKTSHKKMVAYIFMDIHAYGTFFERTFLWVQCPIQIKFRSRKKRNICMDVTKPCLRAWKENMIRFRFFEEYCSLWTVQNILCNFVWRVVLGLSGSGMGLILIGCDLAGTCGSWMQATGEMPQKGRRKESKHFQHVNNAIVKLFKEVISRSPAEWCKL